MSLIKAPVYEVKPAFARADGPDPLLPADEVARLLDEVGDRQVNALPPETSVWSVHAANHQAGLAEAVGAQDAMELGEELSRLHLGQVVKGFDQAATETQRLDTDKMQRNARARLGYHALMRLATGLGVRRAWNPAQNENFPYLAEDQTAETVDGVRTALGIDRPFPVSGKGAWGLETEHGLLGYRQIQTLGYLREVLAHRLRTGRDYERLVEIGGGLGRMAWNVAVRADMPYTLVDLPIVGIVQCAFLRANGISCALWPEKLSDAPGHVDLVSAFDLGALDDLDRALVLNCDGLVEMSRETQDDYFDLIAQSHSDLLSINHEAARTTGLGQVQEWEIARITDWGLTAHPRAEFLERQGYIAQSFLSPRGGARSLLSRLLKR
ncbi:hypothetical protein [Roseivivax marinus]|uniref:hypothetical protein n=1 Tax=Roseivivax marinus TaxID=1379903 RepID=UPI00273D7B78|nr:hypothetical protein [Roseivivax marinus]